MARRRLTPFADRPAPDMPGAGTPLPPIARMAAGAAAEAALESLSETVRMAREGGDLVITVPLADIDTAHLARDRLPGPDPESEGLRESLRAHGQRVPVELIPLDGPRPWGLLAGLRRIEALRALHAETGEARFATVRAVIRRPESPQAAYVAMVEENELRAGLSYYERARIAALTADLGVFDSDQQALRTLFAHASRARRSKIGSFIPIHRELGDALRFPAAIPERLGLRLSEALRDRGPDPFRAALAAADARTPEAEQAALAAALRAPRPEARPDRRGLPGTGAPHPLRPGLGLSVRRSGHTITLKIAGEGVTDTVMEQAVAALEQALSRC